MNIKTTLEVNGMLDLSDNTITDLEEDVPEKSYSIKDLLSEFHGKEIELIIRCSEKI